MSGGDDLGTAEGGHGRDGFHDGLAVEAAVPAGAEAAGGAVPGADLGVSSWAAPRIAYEMTGRVAGQDASAQGIWKSLNKIERMDVLAALGAQARQETLATAVGRPFGHAAIVTVNEGLRREICREAAAALGELLASEPGPWQLPECQHCAEEIAKSLIGLSIECAVRRGISPAAYSQMCLETAARFS